MLEASDNKAAFVTGASRGIGAETAKALARAGYSVALGYQDPKKEKRVNTVIEYIEGLGHEAISVRGDITDKEGRDSIHSALAEWMPLKAIILNAAGGLEKSRVDANPQYALSINKDAQLGIIESEAHKLAKQSSVVFVTSHWSHKYGEVDLPPFDYEPIASSKHLGELSLRSMQNMLAEAGSRLIVVTAGIVTGTFVGDTAIKRFPDFTQRQRSIDNIISAQYVGERIAQLVENPTLPSGHTEWIGASEAAFMK
jgi:NAD(P)-dependent dehydrogenase (short-subunit alcohol dehydrogenase family)